MSDKKLSYDSNGYSAQEAAEILFKDTINRKATRSFWLGVVMGILFMAVLNVGDMHMCVGECDGDGIKLIAGGESNDASDGMATDRDSADRARHIGS